MSHAWVAEFRDLPPRPGPWMDRDPQPPMCPRCQHLHDADIDRLTADIATLTAANAALRRHLDKGDTP